MLYYIIYIYFRSKQAVAIAEMLGYRNVGEYSAGWIGWAKAQQQ